MTNDSEFAAIVHQHRDERASILEFRPCIEKLVDLEHCVQISSFVHGDGEELRWERRTAVSRLHEELPAVKGVYMFVWRPQFKFHFDPHGSERPSWILYVGKAGVDEGTYGTIQHRYRSEYSKYVGKNAASLWSPKPATCREDKLRRFLNLKPLEFWFLALIGFDANRVQLIERQLIRLFNPPLNTQHGNKLRPGKPQPAF